MNTEEIKRILRRQCAKDFDGVFSVDTLPDRPRLLVCNTDPSYRHGRHWVAICVKDARGEYFDSFGRRPSVEFERYMNRHCRYWTFNDKQLQSVVSQFCGHYCICYCVYRSSGINMRKILCSFTSDTALNDVLVHALVCRIRKKIKTHFKCTNVSFIPHARTHTHTHAHAVNINMHILMSLWFYCSRLTTTLAMSKSR